MHMGIETCANKVTLNSPIETRTNLKVHSPATYESETRLARTRVDALQADKTMHPRFEPSMCIEGGVHSPSDK